MEPEPEPGLAIRPLRVDEAAWAAARYAELRFAASPPGATALVAELGGARVGLGRLVELAPGVLELGGIWTAEAARGRGVARAMVAALLARAPAAPLWCIPFAHLAAFYTSCGFAPAPRPWPAEVAAKVAACEAAGLPPVEVLVRDPDTAPRGAGAGARATG